MGVRCDCPRPFHKKPSNSFPGLLGARLDRGFVTRRVVTPFHPGRNPAPSAMTKAVLAVNSDALVPHSFGILRSLQTAAVADIFLAYRGLIVCSACGNDSLRRAIFWVRGHVRSQGWMVAANPSLLYGHAPRGRCLTLAVARRTGITNCQVITISGHPIRSLRCEAWRIGKRIRATSLASSEPACAGGRTPVQRSPAD